MTGRQLRERESESDSEGRGCKKKKKNSEDTVSQKEPKNGFSYTRFDIRMSRGTGFPGMDNMICFN